MKRCLLRWLAVLPGAVIAGLLVTFPLHWILFQTLGNVAELQRIVAPLAIGVCFIWAGSRIAPTHTFETAAVLFGVCLFSLGGCRNRGFRWEHPGVQTLHARKRTGTSDGVHWSGSPHRSRSKLTHTRRLNFRA